MAGKKFEIVSLTMRYWFAGLVAFIALRIFSEVLGTKKEREYSYEGPYGHIIFFLFIFLCSAFALLAYGNPEGFHKATAILGLVVGASILVQYNMFRLIYPNMDRLLLIIVDTLSVFGFIMLYRFNPGLAKYQMKYFVIGNGIMLFFIIFTHRVKVGKGWGYFLMALGTVLLVLPILFGQEIYGAKNWVSILGYSFQPSEFVKIILVFVFAIWFRQYRGFKDHLPAFIFAGLSVLLVVLQKDLGAALLYFYIFIFVYYIATSDWVILSLAGGCAVLGSILSYHLFSHVKVRIEAWKNPWRDIENKGYQIAHSLIAISSGGLIGTGLGLGSPEVVPAFNTDFIFATLCEEFGIITGLCIIGFYAAILIRGTSIALRQHEPQKAILAFGATVALSMQAFTIIGGVIKMIPLTGVTMPFVSYGGSSMMASLALIGVLEGVALSIDDDTKDYEDENEDNREALEEYIISSEEEFE